VSTAVAMGHAEALPPSLVGRLPQSFRSYARYVPEVALCRYALNHIQTVVSSHESSVVVVRERGVMLGLACWRKLRWDTEMFGFPAARLDLLLCDGDYHQGLATATELIEGVIKDCKASRIIHLVARIDSDELLSLHALEQQGFETIDGVLTFSLRLSQTKITPARTDLVIRLFQQSDLEEVLSIARSAYVFDRFHADRTLTPEIADKVNETWVRNSCLGDSDAVIVTCNGRKVVAYATCNIHRDTSSLLGTTFASIGMVATRSDFRGQGAASCATAGTLDWCQRNGVDVVEVGTQLRNLAASRLYESNGFRLTATHLTLRKSIN
jgi:dTDP-4-amino-4,6-dideoxy-D-galactose acyltransferase